MQSCEGTRWRPRLDTASSWVQDRCLGTQLQEGYKCRAIRLLSLQSDSLEQGGFAMLSERVSNSGDNVLSLNNVQSACIFGLVRLSAGGHCRSKRNTSTACAGPAV